MGVVTEVQSKSPKQSLTTSILIINSCIILSLLSVLIGSFILLTQRYLENQTSDILIIYSAQKILEIEKELFRGEKFLNSIITLITTQQFTEEELSTDQLENQLDMLFQETRNLNIQQSIFQNLIITDQTGNIIHSTKDDWVNLPVPQDWLKNLSQSKESFTFTLNNQISNQLQPSLMGMLSAKPISFKPSTQVFWLIGIYKPDIWNFDLAENQDIRSKFFWIADEKNWVQINNKNNLIPVTPNSQQIDNYRKLILSEANNQSPILSYHQLGSTFLFYRLSNLGLVLGIESHPFSELPMWLMSQPEFFPAIILISILLVSQFLINNLTLRPIKRLAQETTDILNGNWEIRASTKSKNEIGQIAQTFNQFTNELQIVSRKLDAQIEDNSDKTIGITKLSQIALRSPNLEELIRPVLLLTIKHYNLQYAALYLLNRETNGNYVANLRQGIGELELEKKHVKKKILIDSIHETENSISKVFSTKQVAHTLIQDTEEIEFGSSNFLHELVLPIIINEKVVGCLVVYSAFSAQEEKNYHKNRTSPLSSEIISASKNIATSPKKLPLSDLRIQELQTVVNLISLAFRCFHSEGRMTTSALSDTPIISLIYESGARISQARSYDEVLVKAGEILQEIPFVSALLLGREDEIEVVQRWPGRNEHNNRIIRQLPGKNILPLSLKAISSYFRSSNPVMMQDVRSGSLPQSLIDIPRHMGCDEAIFLPVLQEGKILSLLIIGQSRDGQNASNKKVPLLISHNSELLHPYKYLIETIANTIERLRVQEDTHKRLAEVQTLWNISQVISVESDLQALYQVVHQQAEKVMGKLSSFAILLYDERYGMIEVPYIFEEGKRLDIKPFPLGEGLSSLVIRSGKPLLIAEDIEKNLHTIDAKTVGATAKSWLGVPLKFGGDAFGVIIVQDIFRVKRFSEEDQRLLSTIASQVALVIRNVRLLEQSKKQARMERIVNQITAKIRRALDMESILYTTTEELAYALNARKAKIKIEITPSSPGYGNVSLNTNNLPKTSEILER